MINILTLPKLAGVFLLSAFAIQTQPWVAPEKADQTKNPVVNDNKAIQNGKKIFVRNCQSCHNYDGSGNGPAAQSLIPKPANFMDEVIQKQSDGALFWKISEGRGAMPANKNFLTTEQRWQLVIYLRTFKKQ